MNILDENTEKHANGTILAAEKLLRAPNQNGNLQKPNDKMEEKEEIDEPLPTADVVVPTG